MNHLFSKDAFTFPSRICFIRGKCCSIHVAAFQFETPIGSGSSSAFLNIFSLIQFCLIIFRAYISSTNIFVLTIKRIQRLHALQSDVFFTTFLWRTPLHHKNQRAFTNTTTVKYLTILIYISLKRLDDIILVCLFPHPRTRKMI